MLSPIVLVSDQTGIFSLSYLVLTLQMYSVSLPPGVPRLVDHKSYICLPTSSSFSVYIHTNGWLGLG